MDDLDKKIAKALPCTCAMSYSEHARVHETMCEAIYREKFRALLEAETAALRKALSEIDKYMLPDEIRSGLWQQIVIEMKRIARVALDKVEADNG